MMSERMRSGTEKRKQQNGEGGRDGVNRRGSKEGLKGTMRQTNENRLD